MKRNLAFILLFCIFSGSCKKPELKGNTLLEQFFDENILNKNFKVTLATDSSVTLTQNYSEYIFVLLKTDMYHGPLKAMGNGNNYEGTWSSNEDYSKLIITLPQIPPEFQFLTRAWRFTSKDLPVLKLAPWGTTDPKVLHMTRQ